VKGRGFRFARALSDDIVALNPALDHLIQTKLAHTSAPQWSMPIEEVRQAFRRLWTPAITGKLVAVAKVEDLTVPTVNAQIRVRVYTPERDVRRPVMLYFHGGGYVKGGIEESDPFCRNLARTTGHVVLSVGYRLSPEHPFPCAMDDALAATLWASDHAAEIGGAPGPLVVCGESAGGNLAAVTCFLARSNSRVVVRHQVLLQPVVDFTLSFPSIAMPANQCLVPREDLDWYYRTYYGNQRDPRDARVSPIFAGDLSGLPPALIIAAEHDTLRDEAQAYAERLQAAGVATRYVCYPGMVHGFLQMGGLVSEAQSALEDIARAVR
jgi:acetyl esterase